MLIRFGTQRRTGTRHVVVAVGPANLQTEMEAGNTCSTAPDHVDLLPVSAKSELAPVMRVRLARIEDNARPGSTAPMRPIAAIQAKPSQTHSPEGRQMRKTEKIDRMHRFFRFSDNRLGWWRCCQTVSNRFHQEQDGCHLFHAETTPFGKSSGTVWHWR